jgi:S1-C subfamily serine protease
MASPVNLKGAYVDRITDNGPANKAGIHGSTTDQYSRKHLGDVIIAVDGNNITESDDLSSEKLNSPRYVPVNSPNLYLQRLQPNLSS